MNLAVNKFMWMMVWLVGGYLRSGCFVMKGCILATYILEADGLQMKRNSLEEYSLNQITHEAQALWKMITQHPSASNQSRHHYNKDREKCKRSKIRKEITVDYLTELCLVLWNKWEQSWWRIRATKLFQTSSLLEGVVCFSKTISTKGHSGTQAVEKFPQRIII